MKNEMIACLGSWLLGDFKFIFPFSLICQIFIFKIVFTSIIRENKSERMFLGCHF